MANSQAMCTSFMGQLLTGTHNFGTGVVRATTTADTFYAALFLASATINANTTAYTGTVGSSAMAGEVSGTNYTPGGVAISSWNAPTATNSSATAGVAFTTPTASLTYTNVSLTSSFDAVLIFNNTQGSVGNRPAVSVHTFGAQTVTAGTFTLTMPGNSTTTALLRLATT